MSPRTDADRGRAVEPEDLVDHGVVGPGLVVVGLLAAGFAITGLALWIVGPTVPADEAAVAAAIDRRGAPRLDINLRVLRLDVEGEWRARADAYGPGPDPGTLRIPVARAAELLLEDGFPCADGAAPEEGRGR